MSALSPSRSMRYITTRSFDVLRGRENFGSEAMKRKPFKQRVLAPSITSVCYQSPGSCGSRVSLPVFRDELEPLGLGEPGYSRPLSIKAQPRSTLLASTDSVIREALHAHALVVAWQRA
jgi:hypothetical protein